MAESKFVTLTSPDGQDVKVSHPADITNLVYGSGYSVKGGKTPDEAAAFLAEKGPAAEALSAANTVQTQTTPPK